MSSQGFLVACLEGCVIDLRRLELEHFAFSFERTMVSPKRGGLLADINVCLPREIEPVPRSQPVLIEDAV